MMVKTRELIGLGSASSLYHLSLPRSSLAVLLFLVLFHIEVTHGQSYKSTFQQQKQPDFLSELGHDITGTMEDLIGQENFKVLATNLSSMVWIVSSGISTGLHVAAGILDQILTSVGMNGNHATQFLKLSPSQVQALLLWGLTALIAYWVLSLLLSLILSLLSRIMWLLRTVIFVACFFFIVSGVSDRSVQVWLLLALLTFYALLGRSRASSHAGARLEAKVSSLECQVEELQRKQRRSP